MASMSQSKGTRLLLPALVCVLIAVLLVTTRSVGAANGYNISQNNTVGQAAGISPDGSKICVVWSQFDVNSPQVYLRSYTTATQAWNPPLTSAPAQVSTAGNTNHPRCAIDAAGNTHVVWNEKSGNQQNVAWRMLPTGADPSNGASWGGVQTIETNRDAVDIDAFQPAANGKVWIVYRFYGEAQLNFRSWSAEGNWSGAIVHGTGAVANDPRIGVDNLGYVHVVFKSADSGKGITYFFLYPNGTEGQESAVPNGTGAGDTDIAIDRVTGDVHVVYVKDYTNVFYAKRTLTSGFSLNQIASGSGQVDNPGIAWSAAGRLIIVFNNNRGSEIDAMISDNGGASWSGPSAFVTQRVANPWVVADTTGVGYVAYNASGQNASVYFTTVGNALTSPSPSLPPGVITLTQPTINSMTSVTVNWTTQVAGDSRVYYSSTPTINTSCTVEAPTPGACTAGTTVKSTAHNVTLRKLSPGTTYYYRVTSSNSAGSSTPVDGTFTTPTLEVVGRHSPTDSSHTYVQSYNGKFTALVLVPAGTTRLEWTTDNITYTQFTGRTTTIPGVVAFSGDVTPFSETTARNFTLKVRFNGNDAQIAAVGDPADMKTIHYDPALKPVFTDVDPNSASPFAIAIYELAGRGIVQGSEGAFRPTEPLARAEVAAILTRALGWNGEYGLKSFSDQGVVDNELWNNVRILADLDVARGFGDGTFHPTENVAQAQAISLVTRAMVAKGYWQYQPDSNPNLFPEVPADSGHRVDLATYYFYIPSIANYFQGANWASPGDRRTAARIAWDVVQYVENIP